VSSLKRLSGFTLIELLIVLTIMMTMLGLVGGNVVESVERTRAQAEVVSLFELLKKCGVIAFASGQPLSVVLDGNRVTLKTASTDRTREVSYEYLDFEEQKITFYRNGLPDTMKLNASVKGIPRTLDFVEIFDIPRN
jgi:prepilin-type N-terminal cleavage/methylation domain-containing protein